MTMRRNGRKNLPIRRTSLLRVDIRARRLYQNQESETACGSGRAPLLRLEFCRLMRGNARPLPQAVLTYLLCSFIILRCVYVEKEVLSAGQVDQLCRPDPARVDVCEQRPRSVLAARDQLFRFEPARFAPIKRAKRLWPSIRLNRNDRIRRFLLTERQKPRAKIARHERKIAGDDQRPIRDAGAERGVNPAERAPMLVRVRNYSQIRIVTGAAWAHQRNSPGDGA